MTTFNKGPNNVTQLQRSNLSYKHPWVQVYTNTILDSWHVGKYSSANYHITVEFDSNQKETMQVLVVARPEHASYTVFGRTSIEDEIITLSASVTANTLTLIANPSNAEFAGAKVIFNALYSETVTPLALPTTVADSPISQKPLQSESGFSSPGLIIDTYGNVNITGDFKKNGVSIGLVGDTLTNTIIYSNLTTVGTLTSLQVNGGFVSISGTGVDNQINNVSIGTVTPQYGKFTDLVVNNSLTVSSGFVELSPTLSSNINNISIGAITPKDGKFTNVTITTTPTSASHATTKNYVDTATTALKINATALAIALGS